MRQQGAELGDLFKRNLQSTQEISASDTMFLQLTNTSPRSYAFQFNPSDLTGAKYSAVSEDRYLHTTTHISLTDTTEITFSVSTDAASGRSDRFRVILMAGKGAIAAAG